MSMPKSASAITTLVAANTISSAQTYNAEADFSIASNPNSVWEYAWAPTLEAEAVLFDDTETTSSWTRWTRSVLRYPDISLFSRGLTLSAGGGADEVGMEYSRLVYRAQSCQRVTYDAVFEGYWNNQIVDGDLWIFIAGEPRFNAVLNPSSGEPHTTSGTATLQQGQTLEVHLGVGENNSGDWDRVIVDLTITVDEVFDCCPADLAEPFGLLDLADVNAFVTGFTTQQPIADLDNNGLYDLADVNLFVTAFTTGCP